MGGRGAYAARRKAGRSRQRGRPSGGGRAAPTIVIPNDDNGGGSVKPSPGPSDGSDWSLPANPLPSEPARPGGGGSEPQSSTDPGAPTGGNEAGGQFDPGSVPLEPPSWLDPINLKLEPGHSTPAQIAADLAATNPDYDRFNRATSENCQRCVAAYDMRARGYDVSAEAVPQAMIDGDIPSDQSTDGMLKRYSHRGRDLGIGASVMEPEIGQILGMNEYTIDPRVAPPSRKFGFLPNSKQSSMDAIETAVKQWGPGSRGLVVLQWKTGSGHVFIVENDNGKVVYRDPQNNTADASGHFDRARQADYTNAIMRVDDLTPNDSMAQWVKNSDGS